MIVMPANATGWFWHVLARETGRLGHLFSPGAQRGPWPWFPFALDNGAFSCWDRERNEFDDGKWRGMEPLWNRLIVWAQSAPERPRWAIVPDVPGDGRATFERWGRFAPQMGQLVKAIAVQDGMEVRDVRKLKPEVVCVGGTTDWKWATVAKWAKAFKRVHVLRCNSPERLYELEAMGVESCDGTGWNRGDRAQTAGLEVWARSKAVARKDQVWRWTCRTPDPDQVSFA